MCTKWSIGRVHIGDGAAVVVMVVMGWWETRLHDVCCHGDGFSLSPTRSEPELLMYNVDLAYLSFNNKINVNKCHFVRMKAKEMNEAACEEFCCIFIFFPFYTQ